MRIFVTAALAFTLAACSGEAAPDDLTDQTGAESGQGVAAGDAGDTGGTQTTDAPGQEAALDLQATGIIVPAQGGQEQLEVPFGSNRAAAEATLASVLGAEKGRYDGSGDCWLESTQYEGMALQFQDDKLVGYSAWEPYLPQLLRSEMLEDPAVSLIEDSTLGEEFIIGPSEGPVISGVFEHAGSDAQIDSLWAGENCVFR